MNEKNKTIITAITTVVVTIILLCSITATIDYMLITKGGDPFFASMFHTATANYTYSFKNGKIDSYYGFSYVITKCEKTGEKPYYNFKIGFKSTYQCFSDK